MIATRYPLLRIHCPCAEPITDGPDTEVDALTTSGSPDTGLDTTTNLELPPTLDNPFALHALNSLYFCDFCLVLRCERCVVEEVVQTYCPACLHVYSADTTAGGNEPSRVTRKGRSDDATFCTRNCLQCPLCFTSLTTFATTSSEGSEALATVYLQCSHCSWDSRHKGRSLIFSKHTSLYQQVRKLSAQSVIDDESETHDTPATTFAELSQFYQQLYDSFEAEEAESDTSAPPSPLFSKRASRSLETIRFLKSHYSKQGGSSSAPSPAITPSSVLGVLGRAGGVSNQKTREHAEKEKERCVSYIDEKAEIEEVTRMRGMTSLDETPTLSQQRANPFVRPTTSSDLLPLPTRLRTRRAKRCRACRHILVRPDVSSRKVSTSSSASGSAAGSASTVATAFRINLLSKNYIPTLRLTYLPVTSPAPSSSPYQAGFIPHITYSFALTLFNPLYEPIKVTLASPPRTPKHGHSITFLTPSFEIGANIEDDWDLQAITSLRRKFADLKISSTSNISASSESARGGPNLGILDRGRNWTSVIFEIVPANERSSEIEVPLFVSFAYEAEVEKDFGSGGRSGESGDSGLFDKQQREVAFWSVLKIGRVIA
ncbi:dynactin subunit 4 [Lipomyces tetrasporus]|uniref:Dynactin subunit 4 n=1 Tax=Lipomyces tetrasporus TaxID=54092 RepID=A0AAD7QPD4_9ASCO|nr:dynactin subunit 4 [Lipomyces tetrasporus]KAJ8098760.1 dynactin subunit 4 [Lipomyces tetrasporus]